MTTPQDLSHPRVAILDAAVKLFGKHGYNGATMRDIAKAVSMLPGSLYAHIDSKETLLCELVEFGIERFLTVEQMLADLPKSPMHRLRAAIKEHIAIVAENPERALVVFHQWRFLSDANLPRALEKRRRYEKIFTKIVSDGIRSGDFRSDLDAKIAVFAILGALNWIAEWYSPAGPTSVEQLGEKYADTLLSGIVASRHAASIPAIAPTPKKRATRKSA